MAMDEQDKMVVRAATGFPSILLKVMTLAILQRALRCFIVIGLGDPTISLQVTHCSTHSVTLCCVCILVL